MSYRFVYETWIVVYVQLYTKILMVKNINYNINNSKPREKFHQDLQNIDNLRKMYLIWSKELYKDKI